MIIDSQQLKTLIRAQGYTQTALAKAAGLSRPALHALLTKEKPAVRARTLQGLVRALNLGDETPLLPDPLAPYKRLVACAHAHLDFRGLALPHAEPVGLDEIFVPLRAFPSLARGADQCTREESRRVDGTRPSKPPPHEAPEELAVS